MCLLHCVNTEPLSNQSAFNYLLFLCFLLKRQPVELDADADGAKDADAKTRKQTPGRGTKPLIQPVAKKESRHRHKDHFKTQSGYDKGAALTQDCSSLTIPQSRTYGCYSFGNRLLGVSEADKGGFKS